MFEKEGKKCAKYFPSSSTVVKVEDKYIFWDQKGDFFSKQKKGLLNRDGARKVPIHFYPQIDVAKRVTFVLNSNIKTKFRNFFFFLEKKKVNMERVWNLQKKKKRKFQSSFEKI